MFCQEDDVRVGVLNGAKYSKAIESVEIIPSKKEGPYTFSTLLGCCIVGQFGKISDRSGDSNLHCNKITEAGKNPLIKHFFVVTDKVEESRIKEMLHKLYYVDFHENRHIASDIFEEMTEMSAEDK